MVPCCILEARGPLGVDRRGNVAPAPFIVPPFWAVSALPELVSDDLSSLPHAAIVSASEPVATTAIHLRDLKALSSIRWMTARGPAHDCISLLLGGRGDVKKM